MQNMDALQRIRELDDRFARLSRLQRPMEALRALEEAAMAKHSHFGVAADETRESFRMFVSECSATAMSLLSREQHAASFELLKKAESLTEEGLFVGDEQERLRLRAIVLNNLGCFYKRRNKLHASLQYLEKALNLELQCSIVENPAGTHFNMCATLSQLGRHAQALQHAMCAVEILANTAEAARSSGAPNEDNCMLAIAYHNLGVEYEYMGQIEPARRAFYAAVDYAEKGWGPTHEKTIGIREAANGCDNAAASSGSLGKSVAKPDLPKPKPVNVVNRSEPKPTQVKRARPAAVGVAPGAPKVTGKKGSSFLPKIIAPSPSQLQSLSWLENTVISEARAALLPRIGPQTPRSGENSVQFITHVPTFAFQPLGAIPSRQVAEPNLDEPWNVLCYRAAVVLQAFIRGALVRLLTDAPSSTFILGPSSRKPHHVSPVRRPVTALSSQSSDHQVPALLDKIAGLEKTLHEMEGQLKQQMRRNLTSGNKASSSPRTPVKSPNMKSSAKEAQNLSSDIRVKCRAGEKTITISVPRTVSVTALWQCISAEFGRVRSISYRDVDGDTISILTDRGLQVAIAEALMSPKQLLLLEVDVPVDNEESHSVVLSETIDIPPCLSDMNSETILPETGSFLNDDLQSAQSDITTEISDAPCAPQVLVVDGNNTDSNLPPAHNKIDASVDDQIASACAVAGVITSSRAEQRAALLLGRCYRGHRSRIIFVSYSIQLRTLQTCQSAIIIQKVIRGRNVRKMLENAKRLEVIHQRMALHLQRVFRGHRKRKVFFVVQAAAAIKKRDICALALQSVWKGHLARLIAKALRADFQAQGLVLNRYRLLVRGASHIGLRLAYDVRIHRTVLLHFLPDLHVFNRTLGVLEFLKSEFVVSVLDSHCSKLPSEPSFIVYPCPDDSLHTLLLGSVLSTPDQHAIAKRLAKIIDFLHCRHFAVCTMTPASFARFGPFWKIILLESCHKSGELVRITPALHSACIPEVLSAIHKAEAIAAIDKPIVNASLEMDVWSYGCILYQIFTGRKLFNGPGSAMIEVIEKGETFRVPPEELGDVIAKYIVENSVCISPRDRILMRDILLYCDQLTQLPKNEEWSTSNAKDRMGAEEWESALEQKFGEMQ